VAEERTMSVLARVTAAVFALLALSLLLFAALVLLASSYEP
jgi:hypothetical protein